MFQFLFLFLSFVALLDARENPFFPVKGEDDVSITSNQVQQIPPLKQVSVTLPSTARVLETITLSYKNLDGSISEKKVILHNSIDWHLPLFLSQHYNSNSSNTNKRQSKTSSMRLFAKLSFIKFYQKGKLLKIVTHDKLLRNFLLVKPHRIVCDFQRDVDIRSYEKRAPKGSVFTKVRLGTHDGYYRIVIELDGYYKYKIRKYKNYYTIELL
jgi:hypothetical protein